MGTSAVGKDSVEQLLLRVAELERRVAALEGRDQIPDVQPVSSEAPQPRASSFAFFDGAFSTVAVALLGFAGAYLLRALAESGSFPEQLGVVAGLLYSMAWLIWAARQDGLTANLYAATATGIFCGIAWENSIRLQLMTPAVSAAAVAGFSCIGLFLAWGRRLPAIATIVLIAGSCLSLALFFATHNLVPFTAALLTIAAANEVAACRGALVGHRWIGALASDFAVFLTAWAITRPQGLPDGYPTFGMPHAVALQIVLVLVYVLSMGFRTLVQGSDILHFEIAQNVAAIGLFMWGSVLMGREAPAVRNIVETFCVLAGSACYAAAVFFLAKRPRLRNFIMYGWFGLALVMAGVSMLLSGVPLVLAWSALSIAAAWLGTHERRISLQLHTPVFLAAAALVSGLIEFAAHALHGSAAPSGARLTEILLTTAALAVCYRMQTFGESRIPALLIAVLLCWTLLGLGAGAITTTLGPDSAFSSTLRTGLICALALGLAKAGLHWRERVECIWLLYPLMLYGAYRLAVEDFPNGRPTALALSLLFYGGTLLGLTRVMRNAKSAS